MVKVENWEKEVSKRDDSPRIYLWENTATGERLLLRYSNRDEENYVLIRFGFGEDISFLSGETIGYAGTRREGKSIARNYMERNVR